MIMGCVFLFLHKKTWCGFSLKVPHRGTSNEYPQHMSLCRTGEDDPRKIIRYSCLTSPLSSSFINPCHAE